MSAILKVFKYNRNDVGELFIFALGLFAFWLVCYVTLPLGNRIQIGKWLYVRLFADKKINIFFAVYSVIVFLLYFLVVVYLYWRKFFHVG